ncbi:polyisoprenoid-binding protein YceI [Sphaerotilus sulfidivorans]|uniref:Polyisoprenoid-binding protein YceI n=1 Tax=Sphaerotilus sulfidivorans TaxID=639200 RepID=A0A5C1Q3Q9_9BURK|nr:MULTISPECIES: YceI family protein [Sphaerotilus]NZD47054.1 YceI family protein [Sphaerotilus sulfidivorans]QEN02191.1 YceI family protein [Sphaerotilus sulfidivorans]GIX51261.1 polyisoprenoid-binding protein [Sphaerotilus natans]GKQ57271.1 polyisoprenoid-binding protein [Sphaerotilus sp. FB-3]
MTVILRTAALAAASFAALVVAPTPALAQQKLDAAKSEMLFVSKQMGVPVEGRFRKFDAQIAFDPKKPEAGKVAFTIDMGSATFGSPEVDVELPKATWFNVPKFPQATFQSSAIKAVGAGRFEVAGKLSIKGSSRDVVVPVALTQAGGSTTATGAFAIKRLEFKIGEGDWADTSMVANDVQVKFKLNLSGVPAL